MKDLRAVKQIIEQLKKLALSIAEENGYDTNKIEEKFKGFIDEITIISGEIESSVKTSIGEETPSKIESAPVQQVLQTGDKQVIKYVSDEITKTTSFNKGPGSKEFIDKKRPEWIQVFGKPEIDKALSKSFTGVADEIQKRMIAARNAIISGSDEFNSAQATNIAEFFHAAVSGGSPEELSTLSNLFKDIFQKEKIFIFPFYDTPIESIPRSNFDVINEFSGSPKGHPISINKLGVSKGGVILQKAEVVLSRGPETEEIRLLRSLSNLKDIIKSRSINIDERILNYTTKVLELYEDLTFDDQKSDKGLRIFVDAMTFLDKLSDSVADDELRVVAAKYSSQFTSYLNSRDFKFFPESGHPSSVDEEQFEIQKEYSELPIGATLRLIKNGIQYKGKIIRKGKVAVSAGPAPEIYKLLMDMRSAAQSRASDPKARPNALRAADEISKLIAMVPEKSAEMHPDYARMALSYIDEINESDALSSIIRKTLAYLKKEGYTEIMVVIGDRFDESYSDSKYERRRIPSNEPKDKIIKLIRRGFLDKKGGTVQKAMVGVSAG
jgi:hypothetical protein